MRSLIRLVILAAFVVPPLYAAYLKRQRASVGDAGSDELDLVVVFEGRQLAIASAAFRGGEIQAWYSGLTVDLTAATLDPGGAYLKVTCLFAGVEIRVPDDWNVELRKTTILGGVSDMRSRTERPVGAPTLVIEVFDAFAGFAVTSRDSAIGPVPTAA